MTDLRERLKKALEKSVEYVSEKCSGRYCRDCEYDKYGDDCEANAVVDNLIANGVTIQRWIPVTERLPEEFVSVLVYAPGIAPLPTVFEAYFARECWVGRTMILEKHEVTHWMEMPAGPEKE